MKSHTDNSHALPGRHVGRVVEFIKRDAVLKFLLIFACGVFLLLFFRSIERYLDIREQMLIGWLSAGMFFVMSRFALFKRQPWRMTFLVLSAFISLRYFIWRSTETLIYTGFYDLVGMTLLYLAEVYTTVVHFLGIFVNAWPVQREIAPLPDDPALLPTVDVMIPTYTEDISITHVTALAAMQMYYPKEKLRVYILDDGGTVQRRNNPNTSVAAWERHYALKRIAGEIGATYLTREENVSAKAGNINYALGHTDGELILMLDCDHVPTRDFLRNTVGWFLKEKSLYLVQTPHFFINPTPVEKNLADVGSIAAESDMFYRTIHPGLDSWNASYFCGSAAVLRRKYLMEAGGLSGQTVTEDAETSLKLHSMGYSSVYINRPMVCGLSPDTFDDYITQKSRWAQGTVQIFLLKNPMLEKGLKVSQRLCYFNAFLFWFFSIPRLMFYLAPSSFLIFGLKVYHASLSQIAAYSLPHVVSVFILMEFLYGKVRRPLFSEIYESVQSLYLLPAVLSAMMNPFKPTFKITPKGKRQERRYLNPLASSFFIVMLFNLAAIPLAVTKWINFPAYRDVIAITGAWCLYNIVVGIMSLGAFWENKQIRSHHRIASSGAVTVVLPRLNERLEAEIMDVSLTGIGFKVKTGYAIKNGEDVVLEATDSYGERYSFKARIQRAAQRGAYVLCGTEVLVDKTNFASIIRFVYGDSSRWVDNWRMQEKNAPGIFRLFRHFIYMGLVGCGESALMLVTWTASALKSGVAAARSSYYNYRTGKV